MPARVLRSLQRTRAYAAIRSVVENLDRHAAFRVASAMAFDAFLSLIPLVALAGYALSRSPRSAELVLAPLLRAAPAAVAQLVEEEFARLATATAVIAPISMIGFLWVSSAGVSTAMGVFETIYNTRERAWYVRRAIALVCVVATVAVVPLVAGLGILIATLSGSAGAKLVAFTLPGALLVSLVAAFYRISIDRPHVERRRVLPGAVLTVVLWAIVSALFSLYVTKLARYATFYGSLATVAIFLFWLWLLSLALLVGGELNARLERERAGVASLRPGPKSLSSDPPAIPPTPALPSGVDDEPDAPPSSGEAPPGAPPEPRPSVDRAAE